MMSILMLQGFLGHYQLPACLWRISGEKFHDRRVLHSLGFRSSSCGSPATSCHRLVASWYICFSRVHCGCTVLGCSSAEKRQNAPVLSASSQLSPHPRLSLGSELGPLPGKGREEGDRKGGLPLPGSSTVLESQFLPLPPKVYTQGLKPILFSSL